MIRLILMMVGALAIAQGAAERIVFDTDPAYFSDDAQAAVMLLRSPEKVTVLGMTIVSATPGPRREPISCGKP